MGPPLEYTRRRGLRFGVAIIGVLLTAAAFPFDGAINGFATRAFDALGGDLRRELEAWQQFGAVVSVLVVGACVWLLDPLRRGRLLDLLAAWALVGLAVQGLKMLLGRPRPRLGDPQWLPGPLGSTPLAGADPPGVYHAWDVLAPIGSDLWSMPSSHTSAAVVLATFLAVVYPRLIPLVAVLAGVVGLGRVLTGAHWLSDVVLGAAIAWPLAHAAVSGWWGVRGLDAIWVRFVDRDADPRYVRMRGEMQGCTNGRAAGWAQGRVADGPG
ncbi:MAG: phosphatase PAP2 family protein [Planctomycetota bacterium]